MSLLKNEDYTAPANLYLAWSQGNPTKEQQAVEQYHNALKDSDNKERMDMLLDLACTLSNLGRYSESLECFEQASQEYPYAYEFIPFHAMCLYSMGRNKEAVSLLLKLQLKTTNSKAIRNYKRAISFYADDLDAFGLM